MLASRPRLALFPAQNSSLPPPVGAPERAPYIEIVRSVEMTTEVLNQVSLNITKHGKMKGTDTV